MHWIYFTLWNVSHFNITVYAAIVLIIFACRRIWTLSPRKMYNPYWILLSSGYPLTFRNHILKIRRKQGQQAYYRQRCQKVQKIMTKDITLHRSTRQLPPYVFVQVGWHLSACCHMGWSALGRSSAWYKVESITNVKKRLTLIKWNLLQT